ncbi:SDR family NAD(P)-dependent oxidoreductase [Hominifimenecus sp. rT4P-3]|uniref:SDR family NAD(P)-dependent oxidoreductase n=1 Tax=Hominifimenecus sp. rT4P-3 TaxID=3242979 RepID=UPI003DA40F74
MKWECKRVVIAGGGSDMGVACAKKLLCQGAKVVLIDISESLLAKADGLKEEYPEGIWTCIGSVVSVSDMEKAMAFAKEKMGGMNVLINCAGTGGRGTVEEMRPESWQLALDVTLTGTFHSCRAAIPYLREAGGGRIVNVASIGGRANRPVNTGYSASKAAVCGLGRYLAKELKADRITVNTVAPGPINAGMFKASEGTEDAEMQKARKMLEETVVLGRLGEMDEIADGILYFVDDAAEAVTGEILDINGGAYMC